MKLKPVVVYQLNDTKKALIIFYGIVIVLFFSLAIAFQIFSKSKGNIGLSIGSSSMVFAFVLGLNFFREQFYMMLQNGISRKTLFVGSVISILCLSIGMSAMESILSLLLKAVGSLGSHEINVMPLFESLYPAISMSMGVALSTLVNFLFMIIVYAIMISIGYLISLSYYKMNKALVLIVSIGLPSLLMIVLPMIDLMLVEFSIFNAVLNFFAIILGVSSGLPILGFLVFLAIAAVASGCSYLLLRKTVVKN